MLLLPEDDIAREKAAAVISYGGLIAFPTDTFYGLGVDPFNAAAAARLNWLKGRADGKPILCLIGDMCDLDRLLATRSQLFDQVARDFWPGPLTIVGIACNELPDEITAGTGTVGLRLPKDENVRQLVRQCGGALTATSANLSGTGPARSAREIAEQFPNGIDLVIDRGEVTVSEASTVLDVTGPVPRIIREGAISRKELERVLGSVD